MMSTFECSGDLYEAAFEKAFDALVIIDNDGQYVEVNESACDLFGLPKEKLLNQRIHDLKHTVGTLQ